MTYKEIALAMTLEEGELFTEDQIRMICSRALAKLRNDPIVQSYKDFLHDSQEKS